MIKVKGYRVLIKPDIVDLTTPSGIVIASDKKIEQSGQQYGTIVQIGESCWPDQEGFEVGDDIIYTRYQGRVVTDPITAIDYLVINDEDIIATFDRPSEDKELTLDDTLSALDARREQA